MLEGTTVGASLEHGELVAGGFSSVDYVPRHTVWYSIELVSNGVFSAVAEASDIPLDPRYSPIVTLYAVNASDPTLHGLTAVRRNDSSCYL